MHNAAEYDYLLAPDPYQHRPEHGTSDYATKHWNNSHWSKRHLFFKTYFFPKTPSQKFLGNVAVTGFSSATRQTPRRLFPPTDRAKSK